MSIFSTIGKLWKAKSIVAAIKDLHGEGFDFKIAAIKMGKLFCWAVLGSVLSYYGTPDHLATLLGVLPEHLREAVTPFVITAIASAWKWYQNKDNEIQWVVPVEAPKQLSEVIGDTPATPLPNAVPIPLSVKSTTPPITAASVSTE